VGLRSEILVDASSVLDAILGYAERYSVDLVVTGTRGRTPSARILMGSVAHGLVQYASCPVLVVR
jgi:nucleotide-binding universal stress UspA family protein